MAYSGDTVDPYVDSETGVLKNLAGIRDAALLEEYEGELSIIRQFELSEDPLPASYDLAHLRAIHRHLFQDVYSWAGELRTVDMAKGNSRFGSHLHIENYLTKACVELAAAHIFGQNRPQRSIGRDDLPTISVKSTPRILSVKGTDGSSGSSSGDSRKNTALKSGGTA